MNPTYTQLRAKLDELLASGQISVNEHIALAAVLVVAEENRARLARVVALAHPEELNLDYVQACNDLPTSEKDL